MNAARRAIERLYRDTATINGVETVKRNGATETITKEIVKDEPCKASLRIQRAPIQGMYATVDYDAKLFIRPELDIPENAEILVTNQYGKTVKYYGGKPFTYPNHQEIYLKLSKKV